MQQVWVLTAAVVAGLTAIAVARVFLLAPRGVGQALATYRAAPVQARKATDIYTVLGLVKPAYSKGLYVSVVGAAFGILFVLGLPFVPALGGAALAYILADEFLVGRTRQARLAIEAELPTFVARLSGMLLVNPAPRAAVEEVTQTLLEGQALRRWLERVLADWQTRGDAALTDAYLQGNRISSLLGLAMYQLRRLAETGGSGFVGAFTTTADAISAILEVRAVKGSKAAGARQAVLTMLVIMAAILAMILSSAAIRAAYADPQVQLISTLALGVMAFGYVQLNSMIADALEV
jgi:hypothetical protein